MNIQRILREGRERLLHGMVSAENPHLEAELLLSHVLGITRLDLIKNNRDHIAEEQVFYFYTLIDKRVSGYPLAYILQKKEFYGYTFFINDSVLIPRPETEMLVEHGVLFVCRRLQSDITSISNESVQQPHIRVGREGEKRGLLEVNEHFRPTDNKVDGVAERLLKKPFRIIDCGTGSGCIAIALALELQKRSITTVKITAIEKSHAAYAVAKSNIELFQLSNCIELVNTGWKDFFEQQDEQYDLIITNPPYVVESDPLNSQELCFEPAESLYASENGLSDIFFLIQNGLKKLCKGGMFFCEVGYNHADLLKEYFLKVYGVEEEEKPEEKCIYNNNSNNILYGFLKDINERKRVLYVAQ
jgi:release factor glutamine methyltransferase